MERALETLGRDDIKVNSLAPFMKEYHQKAGDYLERATGYARQGIRHPFRVTRVVMTDEDSYTCEYCNRKFETIGAWRRHDGRNPRNGEKLAGGCGNGPVPEEGLAGPLLPARTTAPARVWTRVFSVGRRSARQTGNAGPQQLRIGELDGERNRPSQAGWFILRSAGKRQ